MIIQRSRLTAHRYIVDILEPQMVPFAPFITDNFLFMHANARSHFARVVHNYLEEVQIETMDFPAHSPDLNPIEPIWDMMDRRLRALPNPPNNLNELSLRLEEVWDAIEQDEIRNEVFSMSRRCQAVIRARGGNTRY